MILPETEQILPFPLSDSYSVESCLKYAQDKQVYTVRDKSSGQRALLKYASGNKAELLKVEASFLRSSQFDFLPAYCCCLEEENAFWLVREYIEGETLEEYVEHRENLPVREALFILDLTAALIAKLHAQNPPIIHRDIKPQNFILTPERKIVMLDMETMRIQNSRAAHDTIVVGTQSMAPPEQFGYGQTSVQSDIYSLGMLLIYLSTASYSRNKKDYAFLPFSVRRIIHKCISFDPSKRYSGIRRLRRDIASVCRFRMRFVPLCVGASIAAAALILSGGTLIKHQLSLWHMEQSVTFQNPVIEAAARQALGKSDTEPITQEELSQISSLLLSGDRYFVDWNSYKTYYSEQWFIYAEENTPREPFPLDDLRYFTGLRELALDVHCVTDLSVLEGLPLEKLCLKNCSMESLSSLPAFEGLKLLDVADNPLTDISILAQYPDLEELNIMNTSVTDIRVLEGSRLCFLDCSYTGVTDYSVVATLDSLTDLYISHGNDETIAFINGLTNLEMLGMFDSSISSLKEIDRLTRLKSLNLSGCRNLTSLNDIGRFPSLDYLCISSSGVTDLTPLTELKKLTILEVAYTSLEDFTPLADCLQLDTIYLNRALKDVLDRQLPNHSYRIFVID